jgi:hypothetical protein
LKPARSSGLTSIQLPHPDFPDQWYTESDPTKIQAQLIDKNITHFGQASSTPIASSPLTDLFGYEGTNRSASELIDQHIFPAEVTILDEYTQHIIDQLKDGHNLPPLDPHITFYEFTQAFIKWKELTTTSPSGRHLGHYKILTKLPVYVDKINISQVILELYYTVTIIAANLGISLNRWRNISTIMIEKDPGRPRINRLRVLHLYEADYNLLLKVVWARNLVWHAHDLHALHYGQAGSRPGRKAIDVVIHKEMKYLYSRLTRTSLSTIDNDAASCYDRILFNLAMLISKYNGAPRAILSPSF